MAKGYDYILEDLTDERINVRRWLAAIAIFVLAGAAMYTFGDWRSVGVNSRLIEVGGDIFLKYLFIVVVVERAAAVFVRMVGGHSEIDWTLRLKRIEEILQRENPSMAIVRQVYTREKRLIDKLEEKEKIGQITEVPQNPSTEDYLGYLMSVKHAYEWQRAQCNSVVNRRVAGLVFVGGIVLAVLGVSVFDDLFVTTSLESMVERSGAEQVVSAGAMLQLGLLRVADIVVTGGFLGGGSAGLHAVVTRVNEMLNRA